MNPLIQLHTDIDARVESIRDGRPDWLCGKGCDSCCKRLAEAPRLTAAEWDLLREGLSALPTEIQQDIARGVAALKGQPAGPVVCPMLNPVTGACPVYVHRPVACRTYGFYAQRDLGLYCGDIEKQVSEGSLADVVWGNHDAIDRRLAGLGESRSLVEWFEGTEPGGA